MPPLNQQNLEYHKLWRVMITVGEMMQDRHYHVAVDSIPATFQEFMEKYVTTMPDPGDSAANAEGAERRTKRKDKIVRREAMTLLCLRHGSGDSGNTNTASNNNNNNSTTDINEEMTGEGAPMQKACVFFLPGTAQSEMLKECIEHARKEGISVLVLILPIRLNASAKKMVDLINRSAEAITVQVFEEDDLAVNITHHALVPKHIPLTEDEVAKVLHANALVKSQLPRLLSTDPVARYYGLRHGDTVRIERASTSAGVYVTYRQVV